MNPLHFMKGTVNLYNIMLCCMHHLSYHKPLKHILIGLMVENDAPGQSEKKTKQDKTKQNKNNNTKTTTTRAIKEFVYYVNSKFKTSKSCLNYC